MEGMGNKQVSGDVDYGDYRAWKQSGLKFRNVFKLGLQAAQQNPGYIGRVNDLEQKMDRMQKRLQWAMDRLNAAEKAGFIVNPEQGE